MKTDLVKIARHYKREIAKLEKERQRLFSKALKELHMPSLSYGPGGAYVYFFGEQTGYCEFEEGLRENS